MGRLDGGVEPGGEGGETTAAYLGMPEDVDALVERSSRSPRTIVVGVDVAELDQDGPQPSRHAAAHAIGLARRESARLVGVWVRPRVSYSDTFVDTLENIVANRRTAEADFRERAARGEERFGLPSGRVMVRDGDPASELMKVAEEVDADGIVVGASKERIGSVAAQLIRQSRIPVTVVP